MLSFITRLRALSGNTSAGLTVLRLWLLGAGVGVVVSLLVWGLGWGGIAAALAAAVILTVAVYRRELGRGAGGG
jgi:hypothetical protein